jgi:hypothetical protein
LQQILVWRGKHVDLEMLRGATALRTLRLDSTVCDLTPLRELPLEALLLSARRPDLAPLAGHPTLRVLELTAERADPVDLAPLRRMPLLDGLDVSKANVTGLDVIAGSERAALPGAEPRSVARAARAHRRTAPDPATGRRTPHRRRCDEGGRP